MIAGDSNRRYYCGSVLNSFAFFVSLLPTVFRRVSLARLCGKLERPCLPIISSLFLFAYRKDGVPIGYKGSTFHR